MMKMISDNVINTNVDNCDDVDMLLLLLMMIIIVYGINVLVQVFFHEVHR